MLCQQKQYPLQAYANRGYKNRSVIPMVQNSNHFIADLKKLADLNNNKELKTLAEANSVIASPNTKYCTVQIIEQHNKNHKFPKK